MKTPVGTRQRLTCLVVAITMAGYGADRYAELWKVVDRNTGFAHATRGVNMYTLFALRGCVTETDLPVLRRLLTDKDRIIRMATASVLADLGPDGRDAVSARLKIVKDAGERMMLQEALDDVAKPDYRPILNYPMDERQRSSIRGCK